MLTGKDFRKVDGEHGKMPMRMILGGFRVDEEGKVVPIANAAGDEDPRSAPGPEGGENKDT